MVAEIKAVIYHKSNINIKRRKIFFEKLSNTVLLTHMYIERAVMAVKTGLMALIREYYGTLDR